LNIRGGGMEHKELMALVQNIIGTGHRNDPDCRRVEVILQQPEQYARLLDEVQRLTDENKRLNGEQFNAQMKLMENYKLWSAVQEAKGLLKRYGADTSFLDIRPYVQYDEPGFIEELMDSLGYEIRKK